jgi:hypothetical protein
MANGKASQVEIVMLACHSLFRQRKSARAFGVIANRSPFRAVGFSQKDQAALKPTFASFRNPLRIPPVM